MDHNVFISWSGPRAKKLATALKDFLSLINHHVHPWMSAEDIEGGSRWEIMLAEALEKINCGIVCITPETLTAPWLLFEAGALAKSVGKGRVLPYVLGLPWTDVKAPLGIFQGCTVDEAGTRQLVHSLRSSFASQQTVAQADRLFDAFWPEMKAKIEKIEKQQPAQPTPPRRATEDMIAELLQYVRQLPREQRETRRLPTKTLDALCSATAAIMASGVHPDELRVLLLGRYPDHVVEQLITVGNMRKSAMIHTPPLSAVERACQLLGIRMEDLPPPPK